MTNVFLFAIGTERELTGQQSNTEQHFLRLRSKEQWTPQTAPALRRKGDFMHIHLETHDVSRRANVSCSGERLRIRLCILQQCRELGRSYEEAQASTAWRIASYSNKKVPHKNKERDPMVLQIAQASQ